MDGWIIGGAGAGCAAGEGVDTEGAGAALAQAERGGEKGVDPERAGSALAQAEKGDGEGCGKEPRLTRLKVTFQPPQAARCASKYPSNCRHRKSSWTSLTTSCLDEMTKMCLRPTLTWSGALAYRLRGGKVADRDLACLHGLGRVCALLAWM
eukprot:184653-Chlamydomonas_euryale.AAC.6